MFEISNGNVTVAQKITVLNVIVLSKGDWVRGRFYLMEGCI